MTKIIKRLYLDVCTWCRPFDNQLSMRIRLETDAFYLILENIQQGHYQAVISPVHFKEIESITELEERIKLQELLKTFKFESNYNPPSIRDRAEYLYSLGFGVADAAHVAFAEAIADVFITCDDKLLKHCKKHSLKIPAYNPINFVIQEELK